MERNHSVFLLIPALTWALYAAGPKLDHVEPVLFEIEPRMRYASTDLSRWEIFTRSGVQMGPSLSIEFLGAESGVTLEGVNRSLPKLSLYQGNDPSKWRPECDSYESVAYRGLYPGIDLVYHRLKGRLKGDFIVYPGADPSQIRFRFQGAQSRLVSGRLMIQSPTETFEERIPLVYDDVRGNSSGSPVTANYRQYPDGSFGFDVAGHDGQSKLVIDPDLMFGSFLAGSLLDQVTAMTYSSVEKLLLVTGWTESADLLGTNPATYQRGIDGYYGRFAISPAGVVTTYSITLFGGNGTDKPFALAVGPSGLVAVAGTTSSTNFPLSSPLASNLKLKGSSDGFLIRFTLSASTISTSTYVGGTGTEQIYGVALDGNGTLYFAGTTSSSDLGTTHALQPAFKFGATDGFAGTLSSGANPALGYLTYLGGSGSDSIAGLALLNGEVYLTGATDSVDFPTSGAANQLHSGGGQDAFVTKLNSSGQIAYSTYLGGSGGTLGLPEMGTAIAVDTAGAAHVTGVTSSLDFPVTPGAAQQGLNVSLYATGGYPSSGYPDAFLAKFNPTGSLAFATFWGGKSWDQANAITVLPSGYIAIAGLTSSNDYFVQYPIGSGPNGNAASFDGSKYAGSYDAFVAVFSPAGANYWSTYLGGAGSDSAVAVTNNPTGELFVGGSTGSYNFPNVNSLQSSINTSGYHGFLAKIGLPRPSLGIFNVSQCEFDLVKLPDFIPLTPSTKFTSVKWSVCPPGATNDEMIPVVGDWTNNGRPSLGLFRRSTGTWYLDKNGDDIFDPTVDIIVSGFGTGAYPVVGDWDNTGKTRLGYFGDKPGPIASLWFLDMNDDHQFTYANDRIFSFGVAGAIPIVGDWTNSGKQRIGIFYMSLWYLDLVGDFVDRGQLTTSFGFAVDIPVFFNWDNSPTLGKRIGVYHPVYLPSWWSVDTNGNRMIDPTDLYYLFGLFGVVPVVGVQSH